MGPAPAVPGLESLISLSAYLEAADPVWLANASQAGGSLRCPAAYLLPLSGKIDGPTGLVYNSELNPGSVWLLFEVPSGATATVMMPAGGGATEL